MRKFAPSTIFFIALASFIVLAPQNVLAVTFTEDFDGGSLGDNAGTFGFTTGGVIDNSGTSFWVATSSEFVSSPYSLGVTNTGNSRGMRYTMGSTTEGIVALWYKSTNVTGFQALYMALWEGTSNELSEAKIFASPSAGIRCGDNSEEVISSFALDTWYELYLEWTQSGGETIVRCGTRTSGAVVWSDWRGAGFANPIPSAVRITTNHNTSGRLQYIDNFFWTDEIEDDGVPPDEGDGISSTEYITINEPSPYGTTTASTTVNIDIDYKTPYTIDFRPTTTRTYIIKDAVTLEVEDVYAVTIGANSAEQLNVQEEIELTEGSKLLYAGYQLENGAWYSEVAETFFNVATNTYLAATGVETPRDGTGTQTQIDCTLYDVGCQFQKAIQFLFKPSSTALDRFQNLWTLIELKKPFGYVSVTIAQLTGLNESATPYFTMPTIPFMESVFTPIKVGVGLILWGLYFIFWYHKRLKHLDI
jgi:hypothetical protein